MTKATTVLKMTKADAVLKLLRKGHSTKDIREQLGVSLSYVHALKRQLAEGVVEAPKPGEFIQADTNVDAILAARGSNYGDFLSHAEVTQQLKNVMMAHLIKKQKTLIVDQQESLEMIFHKIGRILNGDPDYVDSWLDIAGYATLVADRLQGKTR
jgi:hypothetical protein